MKQERSGTTIKQLPDAFMSYSRSDDQYERQHLTLFRERLEGAVHQHTGMPFAIFQDTEGVLWGQDWRQRLDDSLATVTFLIPILTPSFFTSPYCRDEVDRFLKRERALSRNDLVLPVYYIETPFLDDPVDRAGDPLVVSLLAHQYADWRQLRFDPFDEPVVRRELARLGRQVRDALRRVNEAQPPSAGTRFAASTAGQPTLVVDQLHRGDYSTIAAAIGAARPGTRIEIRPGLYREGLVIEKPLEIVGVGKRDDIVIQTSEANVVLFKAERARIANLTLQQAGGGHWYSVDITRGRLDLEGCDISSQSLAGVAIHNEADPRLRGNRIHDGKQAGVIVYEQGRGVLEDNDIFGNVYSGIEIKGEGNPTVRGNRIRDGKAAGVFVYEQGQGVLEDNDIFGNTGAGVAIREEANPTLRGNRIHDGKAGGVIVYEQGRGVLTNNDIFANAHAGITTKSAGNPTVRGNRINHNGYEAIWVYDGGSGTFEDNDLRGNERGACDIDTDCEENVKRARNLEG
jgi:parallel beta-helix repeat protein